MSDRNFLDDFPTLEAFARNLKPPKHPRTVKRWADQPDGLPIVYLGKTPHVPLEQARQWLTKRIRQRNPRRQSA